MTNLADLDATATARLVADGLATPRELVDAAIARIERHNPGLGAVIVPLYDEARAAAAGPLSGPFAGVPILVKDICATVGGALHTAGMKPFRDAKFSVAEDSYLVAQLRRAGFIILGKTNTSELGILPSAEPPAWPPTKNPYDTTRSSGGSSGGSACAVASGLVPVAHANDGGGSIRIPASCCGLFGMKPSRGRVSFSPHVGDLNGGLVNEHVVSRSVRDSAAILDLLAGVQPGDPYTAPVHVPSFLDALADAPKGLRIGVMTHRLGLDGTRIDSHPDCLAAIAHTTQLLAALGHHVEPADLTELFDPEWTPRFLTLWAVGVTHELDAAAQALGRAIRPDEIETLTYAIGELGRMMSGAAYAAAWRWIQGSTRRIARYWDTYDVLLTPTLAEPPAPLGTFHSPPDDPLAGIFRAADYTPFTPPFNATGQPAMSVPLYRNAAGLPIGLHFVGAYGREDLLFRLAAQLEAAQPFEHAATRGE